MFAGCDVGGGADSSGPKPVTVEREVQSGPQAKFKSNNRSSVQSVYSLTEIKLLVEKLELESSVDEDSLDFEAVNIVVNLPMDWSEFELKTENDDSDDDDNDD